MAISRKLVYILIAFASTRYALAEGARVSLKLFYESDCPDCRLFFEEQLGPLYSAEFEGMKVFCFRIIQISWTWGYPDRLCLTFQAPSTFNSSRTATRARSTTGATRSGCSAASTDPESVAVCANVPIM